MTDRHVAQNKLSGTFTPLGPIDALRPKWRAVESAADSPFFLSWSWIGAWLRLVAGHTSLQLYECREGDRLIAMGLVTDEVVRRRKLFRSRTLSINEDTRSEYNVFIEYNGLLARTGYETAAMQQFIEDALATNSRWDEIQFTNVPHRIWSCLRVEEPDVRLVPDVEHTTWVAPLGDATDIDEILRRMSANRRSKIRRTFKEYEKEGPLRVDSASTTEQALEYFHALGVLHTKRWNRVGHSGSFANEKWISFHEDLITSAFSRGEIQLLRIRCGNRDIGYLYNFLWRDTILMLQSGFATESSNILRPGYVSHILAMQFNARRGARYYDFLVGDSEYKEVLANPLAPLVSGRLQRKRMMFQIEDVLVNVYRKLRRRN